VTRDEIVRDILHAGPVSAPADHPDVVPGFDKVWPRELLACEAARRRRLGQKVVFTNGCFDVLHAGHVQYLQEARAHGDLLVVGPNSDESVRAVKGPTRPVNPVEARAQVLAGLQAVDFITVFDEATPLELVLVLRPDVLVKGSDYRKEDVVGGDFVEGYGGR